MESSVVTVNIIASSGGELSFSDRLKAARREELKRIRETMESLSPDERKYIGYSGTEEYAASMAVVDKERNWNRKPTKQEIADQVVQRRAKRIAQAAAWKQRQEEEKLQRLLERQQKKLRDEQLAIDLKERRQKSRLEPKEPVIREKKPPQDLRMKEAAPKYFQPVIGAPNANGETPVRLDEKSVILVKPGKDIQKAIKTYQKILNIKS